MSFGDTSDDNSSEQESMCKKKATTQQKTNESSASLTKYELQLPEEPTINNPTETTQKGSDNTQIFKCNKQGCVKVYVRAWQLSDHKRRVHGYKSEETDTSAEELSEKKPKNYLKEYKCPELGCEAVFKRPYRLKNHIQAHHGGKKPFKCNHTDCLKSFTNHSHLKRHNIVVHQGEHDSEEVICAVEGCGKVFYNKYNLKKHASHIHKELPFECDICHEKFARKSLLHSHKTDSHDTAASYKCTQCPQTFSLSNLYMKHIIRHKTYKCDCEKSYKKWSDYLKHKKTECLLPQTEYTCAICRKTFSLKQNLTQHCLKVHVSDSQVVDYKCPFVDCNKSYKYKKNLNFHIKRSHEKIIEYFKCPLENCNVVLNSKKNLTQHLRIHSEKPLKERVRRKPRKDKGIAKISTAFKLSGVELNRNVSRLAGNKHESTVVSSFDGDIENKTSEVDAYTDNTRDSHIDISQTILSKDKLAFSQSTSFHEKEDKDLNVTQLFIDKDLNTAMSSSNGKDILGNIKDILSIPNDSQPVKTFEDQTTDSEITEKSLSLTFQSTICHEKEGNDLNVTQSSNDVGISSSDGACNNKSSRIMDNIKTILCEPEDSDPAEPSEEQITDSGIIGKSHEDKNKATLENYSLAPQSTSFHEKDDNDVNVIEMLINKDLNKAKFSNNEGSKDRSSRVIDNVKEILCMSKDSNLAAESFKDLKINSSMQSHEDKSEEAKQYRRLASQSSDLKVKITGSLNDVINLTMNKSNTSNDNVTDLSLNENIIDLSISKIERNVGHLFESFEDKFDNNINEVLDLSMNKSIVTAADIDVLDLSMDTNCVSSNDNDVIDLSTNKSVMTIDIDYDINNKNSIQIISCIGDRKAVVPNSMTNGTSSSKQKYYNPNNAWLESAKEIENNLCDISEIDQNLDNVDITYNSENEETLIIDFQPEPICTNTLPQEEANSESIDVVMELSVNNTKNILFRSEDGNVGKHSDDKINSGKKRKSLDVKSETALQRMSSDSQTTSFNQKYITIPNDEPTGTKKLHQKGADKVSIDVMGLSINTASNEVDIEDNNSKMASYIKNILFGSEDSNLAKQSEDKTIDPDKKRNLLDVNCETTLQNASSISQITSSNEEYITGPNGVHQDSLQQSDENTFGVSGVSEPKRSQDFECVSKCHGEDVTTGTSVSEIVPFINNHDLEKVEVSTKKNGIHIINIAVCVAGKVNNITTNDVSKEEHSLGKEMLITNQQKIKPEEKIDLSGMPNTDVEGNSKIINHNKNVLNKPKNSHPGENSADQTPYQQKNILTEKLHADYSLAFDTPCSKKKDASESHIAIPEMHQLNENHKEDGIQIINIADTRSNRSFKDTSDDNCSESESMCKDKLTWQKNSNTNIDAEHKKKIVGFQMASSNTYAIEDNNRNIPQENTSSMVSYIKNLLFGPGDKDPIEENQQKAAGSEKNRVLHQTDILKTPLQDMTSQGTKEDKRDFKNVTKLSPSSPILSNDTDSENSHSVGISENQTTNSDENTVSHENETPLHSDSVGISENQTTHSDENTVSPENETPLHSDSVEISENKITNLDENTVSHENETPLHSDSVVISENQTTNSDENTVSPENSTPLHSDSVGILENQTTNSHENKTPLQDSHLTSQVIKSIELDENNIIYAELSPNKISNISKSSNDDNSEDSAEYKIQMANSVENRVPHKEESKTPVQNSIPTSQSTNSNEEVENSKETSSMESLNTAMSPKSSFLYENSENQMADLEKNKEVEEENEIILQNIPICQSKNFQEDENKLNTVLAFNHSLNKIGDPENSNTALSNDLNLKTDISYDATKQNNNDMDVNNILGEPKHNNSGELCDNQISDLDKTKKLIGAVADTEINTSIIDIIEESPNEQDTIIPCQLESKSKDDDSSIEEPPRKKIKHDLKEHRKSHENESESLNTTSSNKIANQNHINILLECPNKVNTDVVDNPSTKQALENTCNAIDEATIIFDFPEIMGQPFNTSDGLEIVNLSSIKDVVGNISELNNQKQDLGNVNQYRSEDDILIMDFTEKDVHNEVNGSNKEDVMAIINVPGQVETNESNKNAVLTIHISRMEHSNDLHDLGKVDMSKKEDTVKNIDIIDDKETNLTCGEISGEESIDSSFELNISEETNVDNDPNNLQQESRNVNVFKCTEQGCTRTYTRLWRLTVHKRRDHKLESEDEDCSVEEPQCKKSKKESKEHKCCEPGCGAVFTRPYRLKNHMKAQHEGQKPFKCTFEGCDKSYTNSSHLKRHNVIVHLGEDDNKEAMCGVEGCGKVFSNKYNLKKHIARLHKDLPFECDICHEKFARKSLLNAHKTETHKIAAPYKCTQCPETFILWNLYMRHTSRHKTYKCDCEKSYERWSEYLKHKKTECPLPKTEYTCAICTKTFTLKQNLTQHCLKVHLQDSQEDDYKCPYVDCKNSYKYKKNLNVHIKSAHDKIVERFKCTQDGCEVVLKSKKNLKQHLRWHSQLPRKERVRRRPRKDKGISKISTVSKLSGIEISKVEHKKNVMGLYMNKSVSSNDSSDIEENSSEVVSYAKHIQLRSKSKYRSNSSKLVKTI